MALPSSSKLLGFRPVPDGARVRWIERLVAGVLIVFVGIHAGMALLLPEVSYSLFVWAVLCLGVALVIGICLGSHIRAYSIEGADLVIDRLFRPVRIPLAHYTAVHEFHGRLDHLEKIIGNDGLGAISGHFDSAEHGKLWVYASDIDRSIMLEGPTEKLIVSPSDSTAFVEAVLSQFYSRKL